MKIDDEIKKALELYRCEKPTQNIDDIMRISLSGFGDEFLEDKLTFEMMAQLLFNKEKRANLAENFEDPIVKNYWLDVYPRIENQFYPSAIYALAYLTHTTTGNIRLPEVHLNAIGENFSKTGILSVWFELNQERMDEFAKKMYRKYRLIDILS